MKTSLHRVHSMKINLISSDMTLMVWDTEKENPLLEKYEHHSEFVVGLDFNMENEEELASCSWDETVYVWQRGTEPELTHRDDIDEEIKEIPRRK